MRMSLARLQFLPIYLKKKHLHISRRNLIIVCIDACYFRGPGARRHGRKYTDKEQEMKIQYFPSYGKNNIRIHFKINQRKKTKTKQSNLSGLRKNFLEK